MIDWIQSVLASEVLCQMGHHQRREDGNLGLGWLYYALARQRDCRRAVVIGSYRGFVPLMVARGLSDNLEGGECLFVDPSLWDDFWRDPVRVDEYFRRYGISNIRHIRSTTQEFVESDDFRCLSDIGLLFLDGLHTAEQTRFEFAAFERKLAPNGVVLFHNTMTLGPNTYNGLDGYYISDVTFFIDELRALPAYEVFDFPRLEEPGTLSTGLTMVRRRSRSGENAYYRDPGLSCYQPLRAGTRLFNCGRTAEAIPLLADAVKRNPDFAAAWLAWGVSLVVGGEVEDGLRILARAKELGHPRAQTLIEDLQRDLARENCSAAFDRSHSGQKG